MATTTVPDNDQQRPAEWLNRKFAAIFNLEHNAARADDAKSFPATTQEGALALVVIAANRLRLAQLGLAQADDLEIAGNVASWTAEQTAAEAMLDTALASVAASYPTFRTATNCLARLTAVAGNVTNGVVEGPSQLAADWADGTAN